MTKINIGTSKKNIVGVEIDKPRDEIKHSDIQEIVLEKFLTLQGITIYGWGVADELQTKD